MADHLTERKLPIFLIIRCHNNFLLNVFISTIYLINFFTFADWMCQVGWGSPCYSVILRSQVRGQIAKAFMWSCSPRRPLKKKAAERTSENAKQKWKQMIFDKNKKNLFFNNKKPSMSCTHFCVNIPVNTAMIWLTIRQKCFVSCLTHTNTLYMSLNHLITSYSVTKHKT